MWQRVNMPKAVPSAEPSTPGSSLSLCFLQTHLATPSFLCKTHHSNWLLLWSFTGLLPLYSLLDFAFSCAHTLHLPLPSLPIEILCTWKDPPPLSIITLLIILTRAAAFTWQGLCEITHMPFISHRLCCWYLWELAKGKKELTVLSRLPYVPKMPHEDALNEGTRE